MDPALDQDGDGTPDADNDGDGLFDEDPPADMTRDFDPGVWLMDDDGDGYVDESSNSDDDEFFSITSEDPVNGLDYDGDGAIDEDAGSDLNGDGCPGVCGMDDDGDSLIDEGNVNDDDEDGSTNEDWYDPVVFHLDAGALVQRLPVPWDENSGGAITGRDVVEVTLAENVTYFRVERVPPGPTDRAQLVSLTLELTGAGGRVVRLERRVRLGAAL